MSDSAIVQDCLVHHSNQHIQLRKDFFAICAYDPSDFNKKRNEKGRVINDEPNQECMAKILRLLETFTNDQRTHWYLKTINAREKGLNVPDEPEEYPIELAFGAIGKLLYYTHGDNTIRNSMATLIEWGLVKRYQETINDTPHYALCVKKVQQAINTQEEQQISQGVLKITRRPRRANKPKEVEEDFENKDLPFENKDLPFENKDLPFVFNTTNKVSNTSPEKVEKKQEEGVSLDAENTTPSLFPDLPPETKEIPIVTKVPQWSATSCKAMFDEWRGFPLASSRVAKEKAKYLAENFSREVIVAAHDYMTTDEWWKKKLGGDIVAVANHMSTIMTQLGISDPKATVIEPKTNVIPFSQAKPKTSLPGPVHNPLIKPVVPMPIEERDTPEQIQRERELNLQLRAQKHGMRPRLAQVVAAR